MVHHRQAIKILLKNKWWLKRNGTNHDIYTNGKSSEPIPRHREINDFTWKEIVKRNHLKE